jgi:hypothetical protein
MATGYVLDGLGIESRWGGRDLPHLPRRALETTQPLLQLGNINVDFDATGQLLIIYFPFVKYFRKMGKQ